MQHIEQRAAAMLVVHVPTNRGKPLNLVHESGANLLTMSAVNKPRARVYAPCVDRQKQFGAD
jgi:hypothetical protein